MDFMRDFMKELMELLRDILNEKTLAMLILFGLAVGAYNTQGTGAKDIVIPIVTGICSFITGYVAGKADRETRPADNRKEGES